MYGHLGGGEKSTGVGWDGPRGRRCGQRCVVWAKEPGVPLEIESSSSPPTFRKAHGTIGLAHNGGRLKWIMGPYPTTPEDKKRCGLTIAMMMQGWGMNKMR